MSDTLYGRLGGYDAIVAVVDNLLPRLTSDPALGRYWKHRGEDGVRREAVAHRLRVRIGRRFALLRGS